MHLLFYSLKFCCTSAPLATHTIRGRGFSEKEVSFISEAKKEKKKEEEEAAFVVEMTHFVFISLPRSLSVNMFYCSGRTLSVQLALVLPLQQSLESAARTPCISRKSLF